MTDKELRKLKRPELLEILFYLRKEIDKLQEENEKLTARIDELTKSAHGSAGENSFGSKDELLDSIRSIVEECLKKEKSEDKAGKR